MVTKKLALKKKYDDLRTADMKMLEAAEIENAWKKLWEEEFVFKTGHEDIQQMMWHLSRISFLAGFELTKKLHKELKASQRSPENWLQSVCDSAADRADIAHKELYGRPMQKDTKNRLKKALTIAMVDFILPPDGSELQSTEE